MASVLKGLGLVAGERLAVHVDKSPDALALYAAAVQAGIVFLPLNPGYTPVEVDYFLRDSGARVLITDPARESALAPLAAQHGAVLLTLDTNGQGTFAALTDSAAPDAHTIPRGPDDLAAILYTSGTTGRAKGAMLSHRNLLSNARTLTDLWQFTPQDRLIHALPIFHTHGLFVATNVTLLGGGTLIWQPSFDLDQVFAALPQATTLMGVPTFFTRLVADPRLTRAATAHMRLFISGSAPLLAETHRAFHAATGNMILERYGMTETGMITSNPYVGARRPGTVGQALPGVTVQVCDAEGAEMPSNQVGVVEVRGPNVCLGYWNQPEKTAQDLRADGFFITGDLGVVDDDGTLTIVGRQKDLIIAGGFNVYPAEVEAAIDALPGVLESAVIGVPDPDLGEAVLALVTARDGAVLDTDALLAALNNTLARYKLPRRIVVVQSLPRNAMGKVLKATLRQTYAAGQA